MNSKFLFELDQLEKIKTSIQSKEFENCIEHIEILKRHFNELREHYLKDKNLLVPEWCHEKYCESYSCCSSFVDNDKPECFYSNFEDDTWIKFKLREFLQLLGHTKECAFLITYTGRGCECKQSCTNIKIDYNAFNNGI